MAIPMGQTQRSDTNPLIIKEISLAGLYECNRKMRGVNDGIQTGRATYQPLVEGRSFILRSQLVMCGSAGLGRMPMPHFSIRR